MTLDVAGLPFRNPVLLASGTAGYGLELEGVMELEQLGGIVTKAVSLEPRAGNPAPRVAEVRGGMLNSVGLANPGVEQVAARELPLLIRRLEGTGVQVLVNVVGFLEDEYARVIARLEVLEGVAAWEVNLSCPNTASGGMEFGTDEAAVARIMADCRRRTARPILAKLSPVLPDIAAMAVVAVEAGATGVTVVNTMPGYAEHPGGRARLGQGHGGLSGPALLPVGLQAVRKVRARLPAAVVVGVGGVRSAEDVLAYRRAGADLVGIGTAALADPRLPGRIIRDLEPAHG